MYALLVFLQMILFENSSYARGFEFTRSLSQCVPRTRLNTSPIFFQQFINRSYSFQSRFLPAPSLTAWFSGRTTFKFDWDKGNSTKNWTKHGVSIPVAEQLFENKSEFVLLGQEDKPREDRFAALGKDFSGNFLTSTFVLRDGRIRIISVRPMNPSERKMYAERVL